MLVVPAHSFYKKQTGRLWGLDSANAIKCSYSLISSCEASNNFIYGGAITGFLKMKSSEACLEVI